jgi:hypothetical protein
VSPAATGQDFAASFFANLAAIIAGSARANSYGCFNIRGVMMDIQRAVLLIRKRGDKTVRPTDGGARYRRLAALTVVLGGIAASFAPALAAEPLAVLREDSQNKAEQGKRYVGSTVWRTESVPPSAGRPAEVVLRADAEIPERQLSARWTIRRNTDKSLPASHTIEIVFKVPPNVQGGGVAQAPGVVMKSKEETQGMPLAVAAATVTTGFFMFALPEISVAQNLQLLKEREWLDAPFAYSNGTRAVLSIEKGEPGDRAFAEAFAAWSK